MCNIYELHNKQNKKLGQGMFGKVFEANFRGVTVAAKKFPTIETFNQELCIHLTLVPSGQSFCKAIAYDNQNLVLFF